MYIYDGTKLVLCLKTLAKEQDRKQQTVLNAFGHILKLQCYDDMLKGLNTKFKRKFGRYYCRYFYTLFISLKNQACHIRNMVLVLTDHVYMA